MKRITTTLIALFLANFFLFAQDQTYNFNGTNQYASVPYNSAFNPSTFTIEAWALVTGGAGNYRAVVSNRGNNVGYILYAGNNDTWQFWVGYGSNWTTVSGPAVTLNKWTHLAGVYSGGTMTFYVDGVSAGSASVTLSANTTGPFNIGAVDDDGVGGSNPLFYLPGDVDEVRLWNTARTAAQIRANLFKDLSATESGLVADYKGDVTGTTLTNSCTNVGGLNGTTHNNPPQYASSIAYEQNTLSFDGTDDNILVSTNPAGSGNFSIEAWAKVTGGSGYRGVISSSNSSSQGFIIYAHDNTWEFWVGGGSWTVLTGPAITTNEWTHLAGTYDGSTAKFFVNGIQVASQSASYTANTSILRIGASDNVGNAGFYFQGDIDEVKIYNAAKSIGEMTNNIHSYFDPTAATNLVAYYSVNQGLNAAYNQYLLTLFDLSGGHNGTLNNFNLQNVSTSNYITSGVPQIPNAAHKLHLKADAGVTQSGGNVTGWTDQEGHNTFTVVGTPGYQANAINFNPAVTFNNTQDASSLPGSYLKGNTPLDVATGFAVYRSTSASSAALVGGQFPQEWLGTRVFGKSKDYGSGDFRVDQGAFDPSGYSWQNSALNTNQPFAVVDFNLNSGGSNATGIINGVNGSHQTQPSYTKLQFIPWIGGMNNGGFSGNSFAGHFIGEVAEIMFFPTSLSATDQNKYRSYLAIKYGIHITGYDYVNSSGTTIWNHSSNSTYHHDVFGIGKDDTYGLNQTSSNSINTGSGDGTGQSGLGNIVLSSPSAMATGDFLLIGHDNAGLTEQTTDLPSAYSGSQRLAREWKVAHTNDVGTVTMTFNTTGLTVTGTTAADFALLVDNDGNGDFSNGTVTKTNAASYSGNVITFNNVSLSNNAVFTIVTKISSPATENFLNANLWLKANDGVTESGGNVTGWSDQSGVNTFTVHGTIGYTANSINFNHAASIVNNENASQLPSNYLAGNTELTYVDGFAVMKRNLGTAGTLVGSSLPTSDNRGVSIFSGSDSDEMVVYNGNYQTYSKFVNSDVANGKLALVNLDVSLSSSPYATGSLNGAQQTMTTGTGSDFSSISFTPWIGGTNNAGYTGYPHFKGEFSEIILFTASLSAADKLKIESYLAIKYGITLDPTVTNYVSSAGTVLWNNTTYWNDVFGIGRDDASSLNQPASNSINTGSGDGTGQSGKGNMVLSNPSNLVDGSFLLMGHDNAALTEQTTEVPTAGQNRITREWLVKRTGDPGTVDLSFDIAGLTLSGTTATDFKLLIDADGDFSSGATVEDAASLTGTKVTFTGVNIPDGNYLTIVTGATPPVAPGGVAGSNLWLKANEGTTHSGSNLTGWTDQTGTNSFTVNGTPGYLSSGLNFYPSVSFDNAEAAGVSPGDYLAGNTQITVKEAFAVYTTTNAASGALIGSSVAFSGGYGSQVLGGKTGGDVYVASGEIDKSYSKSFGLLLNPPLPAVVGVDLSTGGSNVKIYIDDVAAPAIVNGLATFSEISLTPWIGGTNNGGISSGIKHFRGEVAEIVAYNTSLSDLDKQKIISYLSIKYGIKIFPSTLNYIASDGTVVFDNSSGNSYKNDAFGIGKDDASGLNLTQSNSANTGSGDGTGQSGKGNIVLSNASSLNDGDFLIIGNNNDALNEETSDLPASLNGKERLTREWKVAHTNDVGTVTLTFNTLGLTVTGTTASDFILIVDEDGDGDFSTGTITQITPATYTNNILTFNNVAFNDGVVFTFVTGESVPAGGVTDAVLWYNAGTGVILNGSTVSQWNNQGSILTANATQATADNQPQHVTTGPNQINFNPIISFDADDEMTTPANTYVGNASGSLYDGSQFAVYRVTSDADAYLYKAEDVTSIYIGMQNSGMIYQQMFDFAGNTPVNTVTQGQVVVMNMVARTDAYGSASPSGTLSQNGISKSLDGNTTISDEGTAPLVLGSGGTVQLAEMISFNRLVTATERSKLESYFAIKYGITLGNNSSPVDYVLSDGTTTVWTGNATYQNDIFGIGKDVQGNLNQTQSNSMNTGSGDGTGQSGKGNIVLSNASDMTDGEFLMLGHDNAALTEQSSDLPASLTGLRLTREWKVQHTGDVGTVNMALDLTGLTVSGSALADFKLLIDTDGNGDFTNGTVTEVSPDDFTNNVLTFNTLTLPDDAVFTLFTKASSNITWTGTTDTDWATATNWSGSAVPTAADNVVIPGSLSNYPLVGSGTANAKKIAMAAGATLDVATGATLAVADTLILVSDATNSASFINQGTFTGTVSYERYLTGVDKWHLISSPVTGQNIWNFITSAGNQIASKGTPTQYAFTSYNEASDNWEAYPTADPGGPLGPGHGYSVLRTADGMITFSGTLTPDVSSTLTIRRFGGTGYGWNLIGNPYTAAIKATDASGDATNNVLTTNTAVLDPSYAALYLWDGSAYVTINNTGTGTLAQNYIQVGQGFFVKSIAGFNPFAITPAMQTHQTGIPLKSAETPWSAIQLQVDGNSKTSSTILAFNNQMTNGLDVSYDAGMFKADKDFALYSRLVEDNGVDFAIQALPESYNELVIPLGIDVPAGTEVTFTAQAMNLPADAAVWLEDRAAGTFTRLDENNATYPVMISEATKGVGNFFIHTKYSVTAAGVTETAPAYRVWANNNEKYIRIATTAVNPGQARVYDVAGRLHAILDLQQGSENRINMNGTGVYLVRIAGGESTFSEKVILK